MQHSKLAARFYRCPTAGKYLIAAAQAMPNANVTVQHAYAMHVYARQTNAGGWRYFKATGYSQQQFLVVTPNVAAWQTIRLATLMQYMPYINTCNTVIRGCVMAWHLHQYNCVQLGNIWQYRRNLAQQQLGNGWLWHNAKQLPVPAALRQRVLRTRAQKQRYYAAWLAANPTGTPTAQLAAPQFNPQQLVQVQ